jgi:hypothetical protein
MYDLSGATFYALANSGLYFAGVAVMGKFILNQLAKITYLIQGAPVMNKLKEFTGYN